MDTHNAKILFFVQKKIIQEWAFHNMELYAIFPCVYQNSSTLQHSKIDSLKFEAHKDFFSGCGDSSSSC